MTDKKDELELGDEISLELGDEPVAAEPSSVGDDGLSLDEDSSGIDLSLEDSSGQSVTEESSSDGLELGGSDDSGLDISLDDDSSAALSAAKDDSGLDLSEEASDVSSVSLDEGDSLDLDAGDSLGSDDGLNLGDDETSGLSDEAGLDDLGGEELNLKDASADLSDELSDDALKKLQEIDAMLMDDSGPSTPAANPSKPAKSAAKTTKKENHQEAITSDSLDFTVQAEEKTQIVKKPEVQINTNLKADFDNIKNYHNEELERLIVTIKALREDRANLLQKVHELEDSINQDKDEVNALRAEIDEKKIELGLSRKRYEKQIEDLKFQNEVTQEKKNIAEAKYKEIEKELQKAQQKVKYDISRVKNREQELESQLELLKTDSQMQIRNRDQKILELKRRIDILEFDMENVLEKEKNQKTVQVDLEDKLDKVIGTLRTAIEALEEESNPNKKKNKKDLEA